VGVLVRLALALSIAMFAYEVQAEREQYVGGEDVTLIVRLVNDSPSAVEVPDPAAPSDAFKYYIVGPQYPEGKVFSSAGAPTQLISIAPHSTEARRVALGRIAELSLHGDYRLMSQLEWQGTKVRSRESSFRIEAVKPVSIHLGYGTRPLGNGEGEGAFIDRDAGSAQLYSFQYLETHPGIGEAQLKAPVARLALAPGATDVSVPWTNTPFFGELIRWTLWREGRSIKALSNSSRTPLSFDLAEDVAYLVRPPLKPASEPVEVLALSQDGKKVSLVRMGTTQQKPGSLAWSLPLPAKAHSITARLAPQALGSRRHIALVAKTGDGLEIFHSRYAAQAAPEPFRSVRVRGAEPMDNASVELFVDAAGIAHVGVLAMLDKATNTAGIVEARFAEGPGSVSQPATATLGALGAAPVGGALLYVDKEGKLARQDTVIALQDGRVVRTDSARRLAPASVPGTLTLPILLAPGKEATYILFLNPQRGLSLERL
jgi:hypothetical protein